MTVYDHQQSPPGLVGQVHPWLKENEGVLGFGKGTVQLLLRGYDSNAKSTSYFHSLIINWAAFSWACVLVIGAYEYWRRYWRLPTKHKLLLAALFALFSAGSMRRA